MSHARRLVVSVVALAVALAVVVVPRAALAWVEAHVEADDVRVAIERGGKARVEHKITLKIAGGPLRGIEVRGVDADATPDPDGFVVSQKDAQAGSIASAVPVGVELAPPSLKAGPEGATPPAVLKVRFGERGLSRGVYVLRVRYTTDLAKRIERNGRLARVTWQGASWEDGLDSVHAVFDLPSAPNAPRGPEREAEVAAADDANVPLVLSSVRRGPLRDELELVRPYAPKGDAIVWTFQVDALALTTAPPAPPAPKPALANLTERFGEPAQRSAALALAGALFVGFAALIARKSSEVARTSRAAGTEPRPVVAIPAVLRALLGGAALASGVTLELLLGRSIAGALLVLAASLLAMHRTPRFPEAALRAPGRWYPLAIAQAFAPAAPPSGVWLDVSTRAGKVLFTLSLAGLAAAAVAVAEVSPFRAELVALDVTAILALFGTGRLRELPPDPGSAPAPFLRKVAARIEKKLAARGARLVARVRVPDAADRRSGGAAATATTRARPDELRLLVVPRRALTGFVALEIGTVFVGGSGGPIALPEVLVRVAAGSPCDEALRAIAGAARCGRGRRPGERVLAFKPRLPLPRATADLAARLAAMLLAPAETERRPTAERRAA